MAKDRNAVTFMLTGSGAERNCRQTAHYISVPTARRLCLLDMQMGISNCQKNISCGPLARVMGLIIYRQPRQAVNVSGDAYAALLCNISFKIYSLTVRKMKGLSIGIFTFRRLPMLLT